MSLLDNGQKLMFMGYFYVANKCNKWNVNFYVNFFG